MEDDENDNEDDEMRMRINRRQPEDQLVEMRMAMGMMR